MVSLMALHLFISWGFNSWDEKNWVLKGSLGNKGVIPSNLTEIYLKYIYDNMYDWNIFKDNLKKRLLININVYYYYYFKYTLISPISEAPSYLSSEAPSYLSSGEERKFTTCKRNVIHLH